LLGLDRLSHTGRATPALAERVRAAFAKAAPDQQVGGR
jgi:hypothetical protein